MGDSMHPLRAYRLAQDPPLSQSELARRVGTTEATISRIEHGQHMVRRALLVRLVAVTGLSPAQICAGLAAAEAAEAAE